jgi:hypothetical protein
MSVAVYSTMANRNNRCAEATAMERGSGVVDRAMISIEATRPTAAAILVDPEPL